MTGMDADRWRAWQALELGPVWLPRDGRLAGTVPMPAADPGHPGADAAAAADADAAVAGTPAADDSSPGIADPPTGPPADLPAGGPPDEIRQAPVPAADGRSVAQPLLHRPRPDPGDWATLRAAVESCVACGLSRTRRRVVFGSGSPTARWLLIGEAPGREEDATGEPFVGQAGRLLDRMLAAIGLDRATDVFIANTLKCRPPNNRNPEPGEVDACSRHLAAQIRLLQPDIVVALGRFSAQALLQTEASISSLRGKVHRWTFEGRTVPLVCTYHPAYLLRTPADKRKVWEDLCLAADALAARAAGSDGAGSDATGNDGVGNDAAGERRTGQ